MPRSRYIDPPTPLQEPEQAPPPRSPGALDGFRRGVARTLAAAPQCIMAGAIVAAGAAGFLKVRHASTIRRGRSDMGNVLVRAPSILWHVGSHLFVPNYGSGPPRIPRTKILTCV